MLDFYTLDFNSEYFKFKYLDFNVSYFKFKFVLF